MVNVPSVRNYPPMSEARRRLIQVLIAANLLFGVWYIFWRYTDSINWAAWWIAVPLLVAETYSFLDACLFGLTMLRLKLRGAAPPPPDGITVDVFITCYNEPVELVRQTARAARAIRYPHQTYILDDGSSAAMRAMAAEEGIGYITRSSAWQTRSRHAKAGNLNNALFQTSGELMLILDADQLARPEILDKILGYFRDPNVALVQTTQFFYNVPPGDPFGSQAPLFYGPIQQGKDGWNAAFFCGSNAVVRREALMRLGITEYVRELGQRVRRALDAADTLLRQAATAHQGGEPRLQEAIAVLRSAVQRARQELLSGVPIQEVTWKFQDEAKAVSRLLVAGDLSRIRAELADIPGLDLADLRGSMDEMLQQDATLEALTGRTTSPLAAIEAVRQLLLAVDVDRDDEAQPVMPMATISITEDMATAMRLHALGWRSVYHDEILAVGLAPEDFRTALQQRLRWAQGTLQVMFKENPLLKRGLTIGQRLMYFATMWSYLSGPFMVCYLAAPIIYMVTGIAPVDAYSSDFFVHLLPYLVINQLVFLVVGWGRPTWRGQQYSLALFPLWIKAITTTVENVYFGKPLGFVVTPKTRQDGGVSWWLAWPQLAAMALLIIASVVGILRLVLGYFGDAPGVLVNLFWVGYDLVMLSVCLEALSYRPPADDQEPAPGEPFALAQSVQTVNAVSPPSQVSALE
jgi:cellulose synthase (UDP-forming)